MKATLTPERLDELSETVPPLERAIVPPGGTPLRCSNRLFLHLSDWQAHCSKRKHSFRGCACVPVKPPAEAEAPESGVQPRINFSA